MAYLYPEKQAVFSKKRFVLAMQRLLASARARSPQMVAALRWLIPWGEAEEDQAATITNAIGSEGYVGDVNTPVSPNASTILAPHRADSDIFGCSVGAHPVPFTASISD